MNEPFIRLIIFAVLILLNRLSSRWLWNLLLEESGVSKEKIQEEWQTGERYAQHWFRAQLRKSPKANKLYYIYQISTVPCIICFTFAIYGLFTHAFDKYYIYAIAFLVIQIIALIVTYFMHRRNNAE